MFTDFIQVKILQWSEYVGIFGVSLNEVGIFQFSDV